MPQKRGEIIIDEITRQTFLKIPERWFDVVAAWISAAYSLATIGYLAWLLLDTWSGRYSASFMAPFAEAIGKVNPNISKLVIYTAIGGGMGAAINNIRSFVQWHAERQAFGWRFVWKYIALPPLGAMLAVLVYGILQSGMAVFNGGSISGGTITSLSAWATGTLAGYGSHKVFVWLDDKVNALFKVEVKKVTVPDVSGKPVDEAKQILVDAQLVGETSQTETTDLQKVGKVIGQSPAAGTEIACESKVGITIGIAPKGALSGTVPVPRPDLPGKPQDEAKHIVEKGKLAPLGEKSQVGTDDGQQTVTETAPPSETATVSAAGAGSMGSAVKSSVAATGLVTDKSDKSQGED